MRKSTLFAPVSFELSLNAFSFARKVFLRGEFLRPRFLRVVGQLVVESVIAELRRVFRIRAETCLDVIFRKLLEFIVGWGGVDVEREARDSEDATRISWEGERSKIHRINWIEERARSLSSIL